MRKHGSVHALKTMEITVIECKKRLVKKSRFYNNLINTLDKAIDLCYASLAGVSIKISPPIKSRFRI